jgi:hypothetical protein
MSITAMKQALEFIEATNKSSSFWLVPASQLNKTVTALCQAIEQAEKQEPVQKDKPACHDGDDECPNRQACCDAEECLYTTPQPQQEPIGINGLTKTETNATASVFGLAPQPPKPWNTPQPQQWVGLTDEEIEQSYEKTGHCQTLRPQDRFAVFALARAIEAKLKEKNT